MLDRGLLYIGTRLVFACLLLSALAASPAYATWYGSGYSRDNDDTSCSGAPKDPMGALFLGSAATDKVLGGDRGDIHYHTGWDEHPFEGNQRYQAFGFCVTNDGQVAQSAGGPNSRYHIRYWLSAYEYAPGRRSTASTPHHDLYIYECNPPFGKHGIDPGAVDRGDGYRREYGESGFDMGRKKLAAAFRNPHHHDVRQGYWGNTRSIKQCDGLYAGSNGTLTLMTVGRP
ncbi:MAG: hypothetical protein QOI91_1828 [Solirubrobacteraceae bacterium]|jgi:hypothetical protein|nr:hypothetical protein [Solirubrobacteraceae bacterium]